MSKKRPKKQAFHYVLEGTRYRVFMNPDGYWAVDFTRNGKRVRKSLQVRSRVDAERMIDDLYGTRVEEQTEKKRYLRIEEAVEMFLTHRRDVKKRKPKTLAKYRAATAALQRYCQIHGLEYMRDIDLAALEGFQIYRGTDEGCADATVTHDIIAIKCLFNFICHPARKLMADNPAAAWEVEKPKMLRRHCFSTEEVRMLQDGVRPWLRPIVTALAYTGMRIGELEHLRWQDIDLDEGMIHITARDDWEPKNKKSRSVPIFSEVRAALLKLRLGKRGTHVFRTQRGKRVNPNHVREALEVDKCKLGIGEGTPHSFRHFFVSLCANSGIPERVTMTWVGHKNSEMVHHYYHLNDDESKRAMQQVERHVSETDLARFGTMSHSDTVGGKTKTA